MKELVQKIIEGAIVLGILYVCLTAQGCNAINGFGQDLQAVSEPYCQPE